MEEIKNLEKEKLEFSEEEEKKVIDNLKEGMVDYENLPKITERFLKSPEVQEASFLEIKKHLEKGLIDDTKKIQETFPISQEKLESEEMQEASFLGIKRNFEVGSIWKAIHLQKLFPISQEKLDSEEMQEASFLEIKRNFEMGKWYNAKEIQEAFPISQEKLEEASFLGIKKNLEKGEIYCAKRTQETFSISQEKLEEASFLGIKTKLESGQINDAKEIHEAFSTPREKLEEASFLGIKKNLEKGEIYYAKRTQETFPISQEKLGEASFLGIRKNLENGQINSAKKIQGTFPASQEKLEEVSFLEIKKHLEKGLIDDTKKIQETFPISQEKLESEEMQEASFLGIKKNLEDGWISGAKKIQETFPASQEKLEEVSFLEIKKHLEKGLIGDAKEIQETFPISQEKLDSEEIQEASFSAIKRSLEKGGINGAKKIQEAFPISQEKLEEASFSAIKINLEDGRIDDTKKIQEAFPISQEKLKEWLLKRIPGGVLGSMTDIGERDFIEFFGEIIPEEKLESDLTYIENLQNYILHKNEIENSENPDKIKEEFKNLSEEGKAKKLFENLSGLKNSTWDLEGDRSDIARQFMQGVEKFGYKKMFDFIQSNNRHDALFAFDKIINLQEKSGLEEDDFYGKILFQVAKDGSEDNNGRDSYARFNDIAQKFSQKDISSLVEDVRELNILSANKLLESIKNKDDGYNFFQNWKVLQKISDLESILAKRDVLEKIKDLPEKHQEFYEKLIFHPNINTSAVIQMIEDPEGFLNQGDSHSEELHELSKAGNFYKFEYSDLTAREIIDMLIEGELDKIQKIPVFEMEFKVPAGKHLKDLSVRKLLRKAIGLRGKNAESKRPKKIFQEVNDLIKKYNKENNSEIKLDKDFIDDESVSIPESLEGDIQEILLNEENGFEYKKIRFASLAKSDPDGIIAGTDTASCDAFGSGKKITYIFNPNIGNIVIQEERGGQWKTLSQATVTLNHEIEKNISNIQGQISVENGDVSRVLDESILEKKNKVLSLDSIEGKTDPFLKGIWENGMVEFSKEISKNNNIDKSRFIQGSYQGLVLGEKVPNNFIPTAVMGYTDNAKESTNLVEIDKVKKRHGEIIKEVEKKEKRTDLAKGVFELNSEDILKVAYLEGKAYHNSNNLQELLFNISNTLVGQDYRAIKSPKMSFKYENIDRKMEGYLVAYEADFDDDKVEEVPALYINDLAALPDSKMAGGKLISTFVSEYIKNYIDKGKMVPIVTHARDKTSYQIILKQMNKIGEKNNINFEMKEIQTYMAGDDEMHELVIYPKKSEV